jgi:hypothetical protein
MYNLSNGTLIRLHLSKEMKALTIGVLSLTRVSTVGSQREILLMISKTLRRRVSKRRRRA